MAAKSIVFIGDAEGYTSLIGYMLVKGYRVICARDFGSVFSLLDWDNTRLIVVGNIDTLVKTRENGYVMSLIRSDIPIVLARRAGFRHFITDTFQDQLPAESQNSRREEAISDSIDRFLNGEHGVASEDDSLILRKQNGIAFLELNRDEDVSETGNRIRGAISYMEEHYTDRISLDQIAHAAYLSTYHFCRLFKRQTGTTCSKYLAALRVRKAKELLRGTELSVTEICCEVGFNSPTYFGRVFKGMEGATPSAYRQCC